MSRTARFNPHTSERKFANLRNRRLIRPDRLLLREAAERELASAAAVSSDAAMELRTRLGELAVLADAEAGE